MYKKIIIKGRVYVAGEWSEIIIKGMVYVAGEGSGTLGYFEAR